jgi:phage terminase large subunit
MVTITSGLERFASDSRDDNSAENARPVDTAPAERIAKIKLPYEPFPKQQEFHLSPAKYRLFGGAAGPGKSKALLMEAILQAHDHPGANTLLLRRTFPELEQTLLLYFRRDVPRELYKNFQESKHLVTWQNGSTTRFGYCQSEHDVYQYQGAEFLFIGIDELTMFTLRQWQFLTSRNRCPIPGAFPCMAAATNPGNIGHAWVKSLWIDKQPAPGMENPAEYDPTDYDFIPARVTDNPIYAGDEHYLKTLRALPSHLRRAFLDGDWDVFAGQYFDRFDFSRHVIRAEEIHLQPWWPRWISIDWGFEHPSAAYWHASVPGSFPVGAQQEGLPGRRLVEPGRSGVPGEHSWQCAAHPAMFSASRPPSRPSCNRHTSPSH